MQADSSAFALVFYGLVVGSLVYFLHKVAWLFRYRRLQEQMVQAALEKLRERADTTVVRWDQGADASWSETAGEEAPAPSDYVRRVEHELRVFEEKLEKGPEPIRNALVQAVREDQEPEEITVLRIPQREAEPLAVTLSLDFPMVPDPPVPAPESLRLEIRSRYGVLRRSLAFFLGVADVVYSSRHLVRMTQNPRAPMGIVMRRMSLVLLILVALLVDIGFGIRRQLMALAEQELPKYVELSGWMADWVPSMVALGAWLAAYGVLYVGLYLFLRWRSGRHLRHLRQLQANLPEHIADVRDRHLEELYRWTREYGATLDDAAELATRQAQMLVQRTSHRLRRRIASPRLLELAGSVAGHFFAKLPEAARGLQDVASSHKHSWRHAIWPRRGEMRYQVAISQYRHAWRELEHTVNALRGQQPDPALANQLWRSLVRYARMFPDVVPAGLFAELQEAHGETVANIVVETRGDLRELDRRLQALAEALQLTIDAACPLVESRIELTTRSMQAEVAAFVSDALRVRERARLEAMAFEI